MRNDEFKAIANLCVIEEEMRDVEQALIFNADYQQMVRLQKLRRRTDLEDKFYLEDKLKDVPWFSEYVRVINRIIDDDY
jgi:hypothetical protein